MISGETKSGFSFTLEEAALDDMELFEDLCSLDSGDFRALVRVLDKLLGREQKEALYSHLRRDGRVPMSDVSAALGEIFESVKAAKKS